jgi:hypothetical protein
MTKEADNFRLPAEQLMKELSDYVGRLKGTRPMLNLYPADTKLSTSIRECAGIWLGKHKRIISNIDIDNFLRQLFNSLADKDVNTTAILTDIKKHSGVGYTSGGVSGKNEYSKDKSRVDGRMIQRKRR